MSKKYIPVANTVKGARHECKGKAVWGNLNESLTSLQRRILPLLKLPESIYDLTFTHPPPHSPYMQVTFAARRAFIL